MELTHRQWAHAIDRRLKDTAQSKGVTGLHFTKRRMKHGRPCKCATCLRMSARKAPFKKQASTRATVKGGRIHSDLKELPIRSNHGFKWAVCYIDDLTRRGKTYYLKHKHETLATFQRFIDEECKPKGIKVQVLRSDHGGEYISAEMQAFCQSTMIVQEWSPPHCQSGNGVSEVFWRDTFKLVRAILWDQQRDHRWWPTAVSFATHIRNHLLTTAVPLVPPESSWQGKTVDTSHFRVPLCTCYSYIEKSNRESTLTQVRFEGVFVGYARNSTSYLIYNPETDLVYSRRYKDVVFNQDQRAPVEQAEVSPDQLDEQLEAIEGALLPVARTDTKTPGVTHLTDTKTPGVTRLTDTTSVINTSDGGRFFRTTRNMKVADVARILGQDPTTYLALLHQHDGWYSELTSTSSVIKAGSDVPFPPQQPPVPVTETTPPHISPAIPPRRSTRQRKQPSRLVQ